MMDNEVVRVIIEVSHHASGIFQNAFSVAPGYGGCQKSCNFNIFFAFKHMRNGNRVIFDEIDRIE